MEKTKNPVQQAGYEQEEQQNQPPAEMDPTSDAMELKEDTDYIMGMELTIVMIGITVVMLLIMIDISIIATAIPQITSDFHRLEDIGWYIGAYQLASAALQPLTGKLYTYLSSKWTFVFSFIIFELGSLICAIANSSSMFIVGRTIAGCGASALANGSLTIIAGAVPLQQRPLYTGLMMGGFFINLPLGGLAGAMLLCINIPDQTIKQPFSARLVRDLLPKLDLPGFALFAPAAVMFLLALHLGGGGGGWGSSQVIGLFCGAAAAAVLFALQERRAGEVTMVPPSMIRRRVVWTSALYFGLLFVATTGGSNFLPVYLQSVKGLSPTLSGIYMLHSIVSQLLFIVISGTLVTKLGYYLPWALLAGVGTAVGCGLMTTFTPWTSLGEIIGYQVVYGVRGAGLQISIIAVQTALTPEQGAIGISVLVFAQQFLGSVFITVTNTIFQESLISEVARLAPSVSPAVASAAGGSAEAVRAPVRPPGSPELDGLLLAFSNSVDKVFYLLVGAAVVVCAASLGMGRVDLREKKEVVEKKEKGDATV